MGQTLSHGVYLPNEGERNCYAGLASNWQILNTAVGAIAEKAPLVHTHTVSQITDFPAYGTTAGTICEGNDSRLSDARTPLAHTHTKSDVTDLLNSNFIPSANNSYDLGSSSYQWNNVYSKNYFYNGVAWGLDKNNKWLTTNTFYGNAPIFLRGSDNDIHNVSPQSLVQSLISFVDKNNTIMSSIVFQHRTEATETHRLCLRQQKVTSDGYYGVNLNNLGDFYPDLNRPMNLGTSTNKWKTLNGVNPGALSLPNVRAAVADPIDTNGWNLSGSRNKYTPTEDGWFYIRVAGTGSCAINIHNGDTDNSYPTWFNTSTGGYATLVVPCEKGISLYIYISATSIEYCSFHPCLGNV